MIEPLLAVFRKTDTNDVGWRLWGKNMRHYGASDGVQLADAIIAATAEVHVLKLVTLNVKLIPMFQRLKRAY